MVKETTTPRASDFIAMIKIPTMLLSPTAKCFKYKVNNQQRKLRNALIVSIKTTIKGTFQS